MTRLDTPVIYENTEEFSIGKAKVILQSDEDQVLVIGAGVTLAEALAAAKTLAAEGVKIRVMDPFTIKPLDVQAVREHAEACGGRVITVEDHYPEVTKPGYIYTDTVLGVRLYSYIVSREAWEMLCWTLLPCARTLSLRKWL